MLARNPHFWTAAKVALAALLLGYIASHTNIGELMTVLERISVRWMLISIAAFYSTIWLMARRSWYLLGRQVRFSELLSLVVLQTVLGNFVATSVGIASYVGLLRGQHAVALSRGITSIVIAKYGDLLALSVMLCIASILVWPVIGVLQPLVLALCGGLLVVNLVVGLTVVARQRVLRVLSRLLTWRWLQRTRLAPRLFGALETLADQQLEGRTITAVGAYSALSWLSMLVFAYSGLQMFAFPVAVGAIMLAVALTQIMTIVPIQVFGGLGVFDLTYAYVYSLFDVPAGEIAAVILGLRLMFYVTNALVLLHIPIDSYLRRHAYVEKPVSM